MYPTPPPKTGDDSSSRFWQELEAKLAPLEDRYLHWHDLQQKTMPVQGINHKQWWQLLKAKRRARWQPLPFQIGDQRFFWVLDDELLKLLAAIDRQLTIELPRQVPTRILADDYLAESLASLHLSGLAFDESQAAHWLRTGCAKDELSGDTNFLEPLASLEHLLRSEAQTNFSIELLKQWVTIITGESTLRKTDYQLEQNGVVYYSAPTPALIESALQQYCDFAKQEESTMRGYMHPILKAVVLHFMLAFIRPFAEGNGRLARVVFYRYLRHAGYAWIHDVALSAVLKNNVAEYEQAFLLTETDSNDLTYFLIQQLQTLQQAIQVYQQKQQDILEKTRLYPTTLNERQGYLLCEMQEHQETGYRLARYKERFNITYETSRTDLMKLAKNGLTRKYKIGKAFVYGIK